MTFVGIVGTGNVGEALLASISRARIPLSSVGIANRRKDRLTELQRKYGCFSSSPLDIALSAKYRSLFFDCPDSIFFNRERVHQTERWLLKCGLGKALILSHIIPFVRTLLNPLCGIIGIPAKKCFFWYMIGSHLWTVKISRAGYLLGEKLKESTDKYLLLIVGLIIIASLMPIAFEIIKNRKTKNN